MEHLAGRHTKPTILEPSRPHISSEIGPALTAWVSIVWGLSSAGRAPDLHSGGQEFDPPRLHQAFCRAKGVALVARPQDVREGQRLRPLLPQPLRAGSSRAIPSECPAGTTRFAFGKISCTTRTLLRNMLFVRRARLRRTLGR